MYVALFLVICRKLIVRVSGSVIVVDTDEQHTTNSRFNLNDAVISRMWVVSNFCIFNAVKS